MHEKSTCSTTICFKTWEASDIKSLKLLVPSNKVPSCWCKEREEQRRVKPQENDILEMNYREKRGVGQKREEEGQEREELL